MGTTAVRRLLRALALVATLLLPLAACDLAPPQAEPEAPAPADPTPAVSEPEDAAPDPAEPADPEPTPADPEPADPGDGGAATDVDITGTADGVTVAAPDGAGIYVDGAYSGEDAPADIALDGAATVGVGSGGQFVEFEVGADGTVGAGEVVSNRPWRVAIVPVQTTIHGPGGPENTGIVTASDVDDVLVQLQATSDEQVVPFSYGTASWDLEVLPMVTDTVLHRETGTGAPPDGGRLIEEAGLRSTVDQYDFFVLFYGVLTEDGVQVDDEPCCLWGGGDSIAINNGWNVRERGDAPFEGFLHEWLHVVEGRPVAGAPEQVTSGGLHNAQALVGEDGSPTSQWLNAYRLFMRSQVVDGGEFTGVFSILRAGPQ